METAKPFSYNKKQQKTKNKKQIKILMEVNKMKKLIAIILSLALVVCMFAVNVSAADHTLGGTDGIDTLTPTNFTQDVTLNLGAAASKYAVDIVFGGNYTITVNDLVWDVNKFVYEIDDATIGAQTYNITVKNYSDNAVNASVTGVVNTTEFTALEDLAITGVDGAVQAIAGNAHGDDPLNPKNHVFTATLDAKAGESWTNVINALVNDRNAKTVTLATFTVTVSKP